jgi:hypothetical protein
MIYSFFSLFPSLNEKINHWYFSLNASTLSADYFKNKGEISSPESWENSNISQKQIMKREAVAHLRRMQK